MKFKKGGGNIVFGQIYIPLFDCVFFLLVQTGTSYVKNEFAFSLAGGLPQPAGITSLR
jgi:hypothetical protein